MGRVFSQEVLLRGSLDRAESARAEQNAYAGNALSLTTGNRMSADGPEREQASDFDVVLMHGPTEDGEGARVLRARPGRIDAGEVRPMSEGRPLAAGGEVVRLERRAGALPVFDVRVECAIPAARAVGPAAAPANRAAPPQSGPAQVATPAYRANWDHTFGARDKTLN